MSKILSVKCKPGKKLRVGAYIYTDKPAKAVNSFIIRRHLKFGRLVEAEKPEGELGYPEPHVNSAKVKKIAENAKEIAEGRKTALLTAKEIKAAKAKKGAK